jgi:hypothetical protein
MKALETARRRGRGIFVQHNSLLRYYVQYMYATLETTEHGYTRVLLKHPPHVLQLARSQPKTLGTPHVLPPSKQLLVGTPHTNSLTAYTL